MLLTLPLLPQLFTDSVTDSCSSLFHYPYPPPHSSPQYLMAESEVTDQSLHPLGCMWPHGILLYGPPRYFTSFERPLGTFKCWSGICFGRGSVIKMCSQCAAPWDKNGETFEPLIYWYSLKSKEDVTIIAGTLPFYWLSECHLLLQLSFQSSNPPVI